CRPRCLAFKEGPRPVVIYLPKARLIAHALRERSVSVVAGLEPATRHYGRWLQPLSYSSAELAAHGRQRCRHPLQCGWRHGPLSARTYPHRVVALSPTSVTDAGIVDDRRSARGSMLAACSRASKAADYLRRLALAQSAEIAA